MKKRIICALIAVIVFFSGISATNVVVNAKSSGLTVKSSKDTNESDNKDNGLAVKKSSGSTDGKKSDLTTKKSSKGVNDTFSFNESTSEEDDWDDSPNFTPESEYVELAGDGDTPVFSSDYLAEYTEKNGIDLPKQKKKSIIKKIMKKNSNPVYLTEKSSGQYLVTNDVTDLVYYGDTKDNKPDGKGKILQMVSIYPEDYYGHIILNFSDYSYASDEDEIYVVYKYMGEFKNGFYQGYGWKFESPVDEVYRNGTYERELGENYVAVTDDVQQNIFDSCNPISYMGEFKKGKYSGEGIEILPLILGLPFGTTKEEVENEGVDRDFLIYSGTYKNGVGNGKMKMYTWGKLYFNGSMKKGKYSGKGTLYFKGSDQIQYKGEWKYGVYDGKGTLYNTDGSIDYKGKWSNGDYAH